MVFSSEIDNLFVLPVVVKVLNSHSFYRSFISDNIDFILVESLLSMQFVKSNNIIDKRRSATWKCRNKFMEVFNLTFMYKTVFEQQILFVMALPNGECCGKINTKQIISYAA